MEFIGRERELSRLDSIHSRSGVRTVVMYGRRKIGKSTLIKRFCEGKRALYIQSPRGSAADVLHNLALSITAFDGVGREDYAFIQDAFEDIAVLCRKEPLIVVLDEFPFMIENIPAASSVVQRFIDLSVSGTDTMLIICGSSISVIRREVEEYERPLYGRFDNRMEIGPMPFSDCMRFHSGLPKLDQVMLYLTLGGVPKYHALEVDGSYRDYVIRHFLSDTADLRDEADNMIVAELSPRDRYIGIVNAISEGAAVAALKDQDFIRRSVDMVTEQRPVLDAGLRKLGFETFPSDSNFILARAPIDHKVLVDGLRERGVLIRDFGSKRRTENCVRTTVGTAELNAILLEKTEEVLSGCR